MGNDITPEMITRFLQNQSDEAEAERVSEYLKDNPEQWELYAGDVAAWKEAGQYGLDDDLRMRMWQQVKESTQRRRTLNIQWLAVACVVTVLMGVYWFWGQKGKVVTEAQEQQTAAIRRKHELKNATHKDTTVYLPDGTTVLLKPGTFVYYYDSFNIHRDAYMSGMAFFDVKRDKLHPFRVYADSVVTTALGTEFWVSNNGNAVTVQLVEGKVMVGAGETTPNNAVYLLAGDQVVVSKLTGSAVVTRHSEASSEDSQKQQQRNLPKVKRNSTTLWTNTAYSFSKSPLDKVFKRIESEYHVQIRFKEKDIKGSSFTGKIMYKDSLDVILNAICNMNDLEYEKKGEVIELRKK